MRKSRRSVRLTGADRWGGAANRGALRGVKAGRCGAGAGRNCGGGRWTTWGTLRIWGAARGAGAACGAGAGLAIAGGGDGLAAVGGGAGLGAGAGRAAGACPLSFGSPKAGAAITDSVSTAAAVRTRQRDMTKLPHRRPTVISTRRTVNWFAAR
jgi:hypothetical protein